MADFGSLYPEEMPAQQGQGPDPTADILRRLLFMRSGQVQAPPESPEMTRALPGYEQRDPNELAMLRHQQMVRPSAGRQDFPMEHLANMASAGAMFTPAGMALAPEMAIGRGIAAGAQYAPKLTTAALAGAGAMAPSMAGGAEDQQAVSQLQATLQKEGHYNGPVDGRLGPETKRAIEAKRQADQIRMQQEQLRVQSEGNTATLETARANQKTAEAKIEADRLKAEKDAADLERRQAADERLKQIDKNRSLASVIMQDYAGPAGYGLGAVAGVGGRLIASAANNAMSRGRAIAGDAIMAAPITGKGANAAMERVARANQFWRAGGAKEVPFTQTPAKAPGFEVNPKSSSLNDIYSPNIHPAVEAGVTAIPVVESGAATYLKGGADDELASAYKAYTIEPSEANIQRIQTAKDNVGLYTGAENLGRVWAGSQLVGAAASRFGKTPTNMRPNMAPAEQEQLALQKLLRDAAEKAAKKAGASAPRQIAAPPPGSPPLTIDAVRARNGVPYGMLNVP